MTQKSAFIGGTLYLLALAPTRIICGTASAALLFAAAALAAPPAKLAHVHKVFGAAVAKKSTPGPAETLWYDGTDGDRAGITLLSWGGGSAEFDPSPASDNGAIIKVATNDFYQGGVISLKTPPVLPLSSPGHNWYIVLKVKIDQPTDQDNGAPPELPVLRLQFTLADGSCAEVEREAPSHYQAAPDDWMRIGVPVAAIKFPHGLSAPLQKITIGAMPAGAISISKIGVVEDNSSITSSAGHDQELSPGDDVTLAANADGGLASLHFAWNFNASNGTAEEASGPTATTKYMTGNTTYKVTLTVSDVDGIKKPSISTVMIKVDQ